MPLAVGVFVIEPKETTASNGEPTTMLTSRVASACIKPAAAGCSAVAAEVATLEALAACDGDAAA